MKRYCKTADICSIGLILDATYDCFRPAKKRKRHDTVALFSEVLGVSKADAREALINKSELYHEGVEKLAYIVQQNLINRDLKLVPLRYATRVDAGSKKLRNISVLHITQLLYDHVAVKALEDIMKRIGEYQISSIKGKGTFYGKRAIERWLKDKKSKYFVKLDVKDFYGSLDKDLLMQWLTKYIKNKPLLWLIESLLRSCNRGMAIGSYLSQTLANLYLSDLYHHVKERCRTSRGRAMATHVLFYMDDILLLGPNKRQLARAARSLQQQAMLKGLVIKPDWQVHAVSVQRPVDMLGFRFSHGCTTLRKYIFRAVRRALLRVGRAYANGKRVNKSLLRRLASYNGYSSAVDCRRFLQSVSADSTFKRAFSEV